MSHYPAPPRAPIALDEAFITTTQVEGAIVVTVACESLRERQAGDLRDRLECIAENAGWKVGLCLAGVSAVCSTCLTDLVLLHQRCRGRGGALVVFGLKRPLRDMLEATGLFDSLPIAESVTEAVSICRRGPEKSGLLDRLLLRKRAA